MIFNLKKLLITSLKIPLRSGFPKVGKVAPYGAMTDTQRAHMQLKSHRGVGGHEVII